MLQAENPSTERPKTLFTCIAIGLWIFEVAFVAGGVVLAHLRFLSRTRFEGVTATGWLVGGICSVAFSNLAIVYDKSRLLATAVLLKSLAFWFYFGLQMMLV